MEDPAAGRDCCYSPTITDFNVIIQRYFACNFVTGPDVIKTKSRKTNLAATDAHNQSGVTHFAADSDEHCHRFIEDYFRLFTVEQYGKSAVWYNQTCIKSRRRTVEFIVPGTINPPYDIDIILPSIRWRKFFFLREYEHYAPNIVFARLSSRLFGQHRYPIQQRFWRAFWMW